MAKKKVVADTSTPDPPIAAFKGFDLNMQCRGYQFKVGETYEYDGNVQACESGFHSCENPLDVFGYYPPGTSLFAEVEASGKIARHNDDSKIASGKLHVKALISLPDYIGRVIEWVTEHCDPTTSNHVDAEKAASSATGRIDQYSPHRVPPGTGPHRVPPGTGPHRVPPGTGPHRVPPGTVPHRVPPGTGPHRVPPGTVPHRVPPGTIPHRVPPGTGPHRVPPGTGRVPHRVPPGTGPHRVPPGQVRIECHRAQVRIECHRGQFRIECHRVQFRIECHRGQFRIERHRVQVRIECHRVQFRIECHRHRRSCHEHRPIWSRQGEQGCCNRVVRTRR